MDTAASAASEQALATLGSAGGDDHATLTLIGYKGGRMDDQVNQDRAFLVAPYMGKTSRRIVGVFDGHGRGGEYGGGGGRQGQRLPRKS